ncbi:helix-turn-helix domain-containing protein [Weissella tructae]|uniref:helix-turn-helix domain-containing protein n=1 Tax=Weissella tructae TaxID=887702 RepID=UPI003D90C58F
MIVNGDVLKQRREQLGISQGQLAQGICHQSLISRLEKDHHITRDILSIIDTKKHRTFACIRCFLSYLVRSNSLYVGNICGTYAEFPAPDY